MILHSISAGMESANNMTMHNILNIDKTRMLSKFARDVYYIGINVTTNLLGILDYLLTNFL